MTNDQLWEGWKLAGRYALPTAALILVAILVGVFGPVGMAAGFVVAGAIWVVGSVVGVSRLRAWYRKITVDH